MYFPMYDGGNETEQFDTWIVWRFLAISRRMDTTGGTLSGSNLKVSFDGTSLGGPGPISIASANYLSRVVFQVGAQNLPVIAAFYLAATRCPFTW